MRVLRVAHDGPVSTWRERELIALGADLTLVSAQHWNEAGRDVVLEADGDDFVVGARVWGSHPYLFLYDPRVLWRELGRGWDLIDLREEPASLATAEVRLLARLRRQRAPYVIHSAQNLAKRYPPPFRWLERSALRSASGAYVCTREAGEVLRSKGLTAPAPLVPHGVDATLLRPAERSRPRSEPRIGYAGRLEPHKGAEVLLRAVALHPEWSLELLGDGPQRAELEALAEELGITRRVTFWGALDARMLAWRLRGLDVLAVPSLASPRWVERFGRVAVEAMASGTPVVASACGALPDVLGDAGVLVPPGDVDALADGIVLALERWADLRLRGLRRGWRFAWPGVARAQFELYCAAARIPAPRKGLQVVIVTGSRGSGALHDAAGGLAGNLAGCLERLGGDLPVTVVDGSCRPGTRELVLRHGGRYLGGLGPSIGVGIGAGLDLALADLAERGLQDHDVLLLDPSARIGPDAVEALHARIGLDDQVGCAVPTAVDLATGRPARAVRPFPTPLGAWLEALGLGVLRRRPGAVAGPVRLLRAEALRELGGFDTRLLEAGEMDWQRRARDRGWRLAVAPVAACHVGAGSGGDPALHDLRLHAGQELYVRKYHGAIGWALLRAGVVVGSAIRAVVLAGERRASARRLLRLYLDGPVAALDPAPRLLVAGTAEGPRPARRADRGPSGAAGGR